MECTLDEIQGEVLRAISDAYQAGLRDGRRGSRGIGQGTEPPDGAMPIARDTSPHAVAERVLAAVRAAPAGITRTEIIATTGDRNRAVSKALQLLKDGRKVMNYGHCWKARTNRPIPPIEAA